MHARIKNALLLTLTLGMLGAGVAAAAFRLADTPPAKAPAAEPPAKARVFKSTLPLIVYQIVDGEPLKTLGQTGPGGAAKGVNIPAGANWAVQPIAGFGGGFGQLGNLGGQFGIMGGGLQLGGFGGAMPPGAIGAVGAVGGMIGGVPPKGKLPKGKAPPAPVFGMKLEGAGLKALVTEMKKQSIPGLVLDFPPISAEDFGQIANIAGLRSLIVRGSSGFSPEHLAKLEAAKALRFLSIEHVPVKPEGLKALAKAPALAELHLAGEGLTSKDMEALGGMKYLTALRWQHGPGADGLAFLKGLASLKRLELVGGFTDTDLKALKEMSNLEVVRLFQTATTDDVMDLLKPHKDLRVLALDGHRSPVGVGMQPLATVNAGKLHWHMMNGFGGGLGGLNLGGGLALGGAAGFMGGPGVGAMPGPQFTAKSLERLADFDKLAEVSVYHNKLKDADVAPLAKLTGLRRLALFAPEVTDAGVNRLKALTKLEVLDLRGTDITTAAAAALRALPALRVLRVNLVAEDAGHKKKLATWRAALPKVSVQPLPTTAGITLGAGGFGGFGGAGFGIGGGAIGGGAMLGGKP